MLSSKLGQAKIATDGLPGPEDAGRTVFHGATAVLSPPESLTPSGLRIWGGFRQEPAPFF